MDLAALKDAQKALDARGNSDGFISHKDLTEEGLLTRLLPEPPILNGYFYFPVIKYWMTVNGKRASFICPSTFGKRSPIAEEIEKAKQSEDEDVVALATDTDSSTGCVRSEEWWWACLVLKYSIARDGSIEKVTVVDSRAKVFQCGKKTLVSDIISKITGPQATRKTKGVQDGAADRKLGLNLLLSKVGVKLATKYACVLDEQMEMPPKFYTHIPNVYEIAKAQMSVPSYQRAAVKLYLYGEEIPDEVQKKEDARKAAAKEVLKEEMGITVVAKPAEEEEKPAKRKPTVSEDADDDDDAPVAKKSAKKRQTDDDDEEETPVAKKSAKRRVVEDDEEEEEAPKKSAKKRVVEDDEEEEEPKPAKKTAKKSVVEDDDDEDELPKKTATKKSKVFDEDDDDEDRPAPREKVKQVAKKKVVDDDEEEEEEKPKNKVAPAPGKGSKVPGDTGKKKSILDDIDDIEDDDLED